MPQGQNGSLPVQRQLQNNMALHAVRRDKLRAKKGNEWHVFQYATGLVL